ncbi:MAG TPA: DUF6512 family protein [Spirochaetia bacterium]|nr:DUF6512 family protein [Spirochaetia bacterium]
MRLSVLQWTIIGFFFLVLGGSMLHFTYAWFRHFPIVGIFSAVNESVWEHLKLGFWALFFFSLIEFWFVRDAVRMYFLAKAAGIVAMQVVIVFFFYSYTAILKRNILFVDISLFVIGSLVCQVLCYKILTSRAGKGMANILGIAILILNGLAFIIFTFLPPRLPLFRDSATGGYGTARRSSLGTSERDSCTLSPEQDEKKPGRRYAAKMNFPH